MIVRPFQNEDEGALREMHARFGYRYPCPEDFSGFQVVEDDAGNILMAAGWKLIPEIILVANPDAKAHPLMKLKGIAMLHDRLRGIISSLGFTEAIAFTAPELKRFRAHLQAHWGWIPEWETLRNSWRGP